MIFPSQQFTGGYASSHPPTDQLPIMAAPATKNEKNVIRQSLLAVACWRLNDLRFDFDSSFVMPAAQEEMIVLRKICDLYPGSPLSIFGHADPVGKEDYNKVLSGRRAEAIYAVLIHDPARWEQLYANDHGGDEWGLKHVQIILEKLEFDPGNTAGDATKKSKAAIETFQLANELHDDGDAGPKTRAKLFQKYFEFLFPRKLEKSEFLGQGLDPLGKGDFQGCGELNPAMILSAEEANKLSDTERNLENGVNRRVLILFFRPGTVANGDQWPCPRASESAAGCTKRLWSDADTRRLKGGTRRTFADTEDTFACRFYHRLTESSPCEVSAAKLMFVEIFLDLPDTAEGMDDKFQLVSGDGEYDRTLMRENAAAREATQFVLIFSNVISGQNYALYHYPSPGVKVEIFANVPFDSINQTGGAESELQLIKAVTYEREPPPVLYSNDPDLYDDPDDHFHFDGVIGDPHDTGGALLEGVAR